MISIVLPTYNDGTQLAWALASLVAQTDTDWECIIVDDGSSRPAQIVVDAFRDERFRVLTHSENRGRGEARLTGMREVRGEYVAWHDADDWSKPNRLAAQRAALKEHRDVGFAFTGVCQLEHGELAGLGWVRPDGPRTLKALEDLPIHPPTVLMRSAVLEEVPYTSHLRYGEDAAFLIPALRRFPFVNVPDLLYTWEISAAHTVRKYVAANLSLIRVHAKTSGREKPLGTAARTTKLAAGIVGYPILSALGQSERWIGRGLGTFEPIHEAEFCEIRETVGRCIPPSLSGDSARL